MLINNFAPVIAQKCLFEIFNYILSNKSAKNTKNACFYRSTTFCFISLILVYDYVMFKKMSRNALSDIKHEAIAECFSSNKARTARFLNSLKNKSFNMPIHKESLKINVFEAEKFGGEKQACFYHK